MKSIHRMLFVAGLLFVLMSSCKKSGDAFQGYYVKFKWNDSLVTWTTLSGQVVRDPDDSNRSIFSLTAASKDTSDVLYLNIDFLDTVVETGQYASNLSGPVVTAQFFIAFDSPAQDEFDINNINGMAPSVFSMALNAISSNGIRGTFSGNYLCDVFNYRVIEISDGEFYVPQ